jgi:ferric-dicitrate binding protein FerR (iron transport regulator)
VLKPNEQAISKAGTFKVQAANIGIETAWVKNDFYFRGETLENVLRDVARWYDVTISYSNEALKTTPLIGQISRTKPLSAVLERIASAGGTRFKIEGKQVTVMPDLK